MCGIKHTCKLNTPHTCTYPYKVSATKRSSLVPVLSYRLGNPRQTAFVAPCSYLDTYVCSSHILLLTIGSYILVTYALAIYFSFQASAGG